MVRLEGGYSNVQFVTYIADPALPNKQPDYEGDPQKRMPSGCKILSPRARLLHRAMGNPTFGPEAENVVTTPGHIKRFTDDRGLSIGFPKHSRPWASRKNT